MTSPATAVARREDTETADSFQAATTSAMQRIMFRMVDSRMLGTKFGVSQIVQIVALGTDAKAEDFMAAATNPDCVKVAHYAVMQSNQPLSRGDVVFIGMYDAANARITDVSETDMRADIPDNVSTKPLVAELSRLSPRSEAPAQVVTKPVVRSRIM